MEIKSVVLLLIVFRQIIFIRGEESSIKYRDYVLNKVFRINPEDRLEEQPDRKLEPTFKDFYRQGVDSYLQNDWDGCIHFLKQAIVSYREYVDIVANCRISCESERYKRPLFSQDPDNLHFYEGILKKTLCLKKCISQALPYNFPVYFYLDSVTKNTFETRVPYDYLQLCYFKEGDLKNAVSSTYTVLTVRPNDTLSLTNLKFYTSQPEFDISWLVDMEERKFVQYYLDGIKAYNEENWSASINYLEKSIELFLEENEKCRAFCEDSFNQGWFPDFVSSTANHFVYCLRCKLNCTKSMTKIRTETYGDVFPSHYEYLQLAYYKLDNLEMACRATKTYLTFYPRKATMQENLEFYEKNLPEGKDCTQPLADGIKYFHRIRYEYHLIYFIDSEFYKFVI